MAIVNTQPYLLKQLKAWLFYCPIFERKQLTSLLKTSSPLFGSLTNNTLRAAGWAGRPKVRI